ncbi:MAG: PKD domain-containing protein [Phycisphaerales bacterium JB050]
MRFFTDTTVWTGDLDQGPAGQATPARFTYSFPPDGTTWGLAEVDAIGPSNLDERLLAEFGADNIDLGREYLRQSLASWRKYSANTYFEVADDGSPMDQITTRTETRGDIRIGGRDFGTGAFLAYNAFPSAEFAGIGGSDMVINNSFWGEANFGNAANNYRYLRNTVAHEHGHGLGFIHVTPCEETKLMEPFISTQFDVVRTDERRNAGRNYGDRFAGNHSMEDAAALGSLNDDGGRSVALLQLSTNGVSGPGNTGEDWFSFTLEASTAVRVNATPTGGTYSNGQQFFSCFGFNDNVNAQNAGNLEVRLFDEDGEIASASSAGAGQPEELSRQLDPGTYYILVKDTGPNATSNQVVQMYDLRVSNIGSLLFPNPIPADPYANAGLNSKRVAANTNAWFIGDINSDVTEAGATIVNYDWDLDGDGSFESLGVAKPVTQYESNGSYQVTLRVTDSNGKQATDTITCVVYGATTTLDYTGPAEAEQGATVEITLTGTNLKNVESASEFSVSGSGVSIVGVPMPNARGTEVTGLFLELETDAALGARSITIANADGSATVTDAFVVVEGTVTDAFVVVEGTGADCPGDVNDSGSVDLADLNLVLANFGQTTSDGDADGSGTVDLADLNLVLAAFGTVCP